MLGNIPNGMRPDSDTDRGYPEKGCLGRGHGVS